MNKKLIIALAALAAMSQGATAQRFTDKLDRGLVAVKTSSGVLCTWRINADEWNGVEYNLYRGGSKVNPTPLTVSNFTDASGSLSDTYTVKAVVNGVEQQACSPVKVWEKNYTIITPKHASEISVSLTPNDATAADVDGDGQLEIIMKYDTNFAEFSKGDNGIFTVIECLEMDGTVKWWINCGPNMGDFQNNEINIAAYDWDMDGKAEVVFRAADGTQIHQADGTVYTVGDASINYRSGDWPGSQWFMRWGKEYLIYANGETGQPYDDIEYPLKRVEDADNPSGQLSGGSYDNLISSEWGDGYGHRSSKYFFAAPYLDGKRPSIFLGRGIYTKHKFVTFDVDLGSHKLIERWRWTSDGKGEAWFGQGYHNMGIADVDWDGRDEIVYGSMVIDDNGKGLSTTGLGHGDSQHCGDFDPYSHGQEIFACNEDRPNNNFRNATTSKIYYRTTGGNDDGRANCGNFIDEYPGSEGLSTRDGALIGGASHKAIVGDDKGTVSITQNFRVFWDGDLCDESYDYANGKNTQGAIFKAKGGRIAVLEGSKTNNDTKGTPCFQGDILGDWREEYIMRDGDNNIRIYTTDYPTDYRIYSLWYDHQYRNAMVWQMCGYNQTPHVSFALSQFEGLTVPPQPLTLTGRELVDNGGTIGTDLNGKNVQIHVNADATIAVADGAKPAILFANVPTWVQGHDDNNNITTRYYKTTLTGGLLSGNTQLVKQGDGKLQLPAGVHSHSGKSDIEAGTLIVDGEFTNSPVWLNRFAVLETKDLQLPKGLDMDYAAVLRLGDATDAGKLSTGELTLGFGSVVELDVFGNQTIDGFSADKLTVETKDWTNGPEYMHPVIKLTEHLLADQIFVPAGRYLIGEIGSVAGNISDIELQGMDDMKKSLVYEGGKLYLDLVAYDSAAKTWHGGEAGVWDLDNSASFTHNETGESMVFVPGDDVTFDDNAAHTTVTISGRLKPTSVTFKNDATDYTLQGDGQIVGNGRLTKQGEGTLTINNINAYEGGTYINGGKLVVNSLSNNIGDDYGALSHVGSRIYLNNSATLSVSNSLTMSQPIFMQGKGQLEVPEGLTLTVTKGIATTGLGQALTKTGKGTLAFSDKNPGVNRLIIDGGTVQPAEVDGVVALPSNVEFIDGLIRDPDNSYTYTTNRANFIVGEGNTGGIRLDARCNYTGKLTGKGKFTVYGSWYRHYLQGDWSGFEGELVAAYDASGSVDLAWDNDYGMPKATLNIGAGVVFNTNSRNVALGNIRGTGTYNGSGNLTVGNNDTPIQFTGTFTSKPKFVKVGKCDWYLSKLVDGLASIVVRDGTVSLNASKSPFNTEYFNSTLQLEATSKLRGRGTVADINMTGTAVLEPGIYNNSNGYRYGPIFSTGNVTVGETAALSFYLRVAGKNNDCSYIDVAGKLTVYGYVKVEMASNYEPKAGDQFTLWKAGSFAGNPTIELPELPAGLLWNTEALNTANGVIKVVADAGVNGVMADGTPVVCEVYNTAGVFLGRLETTSGEAAKAVQTEFNLEPGIYMLKLTAADSVRTVKVQY